MSGGPLKMVIETDAGAINLRSSRELGAYNVERVRGYIEKHVMPSQKQICRDLNLSPHTVARCVKIIRGQQ